MHGQQHAACRLIAAQSLGQIAGIANTLQAEWQRRALGYGPKHEDPPRPYTHRDWLLKEAIWLAKDMGQVGTRGKLSKYSGLHSKMVVLKTTTAHDVSRES